MVMKADKEARTCGPQAGVPGKLGVARLHPKAGEQGGSAQKTGVPAPQSGRRGKFFLSLPFGSVQIHSRLGRVPLTLGEPTAPLVHSFKH